MNFSKFKKIIELVETFAKFQIRDREPRFGIFSFCFSCCGVGSARGAPAAAACPKAAPRLSAARRLPACQVLFLVYRRTATARARALSGSVGWKRLKHAVHVALQKSKPLCALLRECRGEDSEVRLIECHEACQVQLQCRSNNKSQLSTSVLGSKRILENISPALLFSRINVKEIITFEEDIP